MPNIENFPAICSGAAMKIIETVTLWYDRRSIGSDVPDGLASYIRGEHHLYLKQVPSALTLRKAGSTSIAQNQELLVKNGFSVFDAVASKDSSEIPESPFGDSVELPLDNIEPEYFNEDEEIPEPEIRSSGIDYEDPFKILAAYSWATHMERTPPKIRVWAGSCFRLQGKLSQRMLGRPNKGHSVHFGSIDDHAGKMFLVMNHTHWGHWIKTNATTKESPYHGFAQTLKRRISFFLNGRHDPAWSKTERAGKFVSDGERTRNRKERSRRLIEVLKTVDGLFLQRYTSYPEEVWTWEKFDLFCVQLISILITDEFMDGSVTIHTLGLKSFYSQLKSARKMFKLVIHQEEPQRHQHLLDEVPMWVNKYLRKTWEHAMRTRGFNRLFLAGILSQTRGAGTPPPLVILQSKDKFLTTVTDNTTRLTRTQEALIAKSLQTTLGKLPREAFTGLATKARVTVTGSSCWEDTRREGGTAQAVLDLMSEYTDGNYIPIRDLDTGNVIAHREKESFSSVGEAVFWACLDRVLHTPPEVLGDVYLTVVKEPGKGRSVTKGRAALKIVLDTISKICAHPLKKGIRTSKSGMGASHHGWNMFLELFEDGNFEEIFSEETREDLEFADYKQRHIVWEDVYIGSTDFQEATDRMHHRFAEIAGTMWMTKCGIPQILQGIVRRICYRPRRIFFTGTGVLEKHGTMVDDHGTRMVILYRGILMGDPLTKIVLHLSNIASREIGESITDGSLLSTFMNGAEASQRYSNAKTVDRTTS